jgi:hypothetical protein
MLHYLSINVNHFNIILIIFGKIDETVTALRQHPNENNTHPAIKITRQVIAGQAFQLEPAESPLPGNAQVDARPAI